MNSLSKTNPILSHLSFLWHLTHSYSMILTCVSNNFYANCLFSGYMNTFSNELQLKKDDWSIYFIFLPKYIECKFMHDANAFLLIISKLSGKCKDSMLEFYENELSSIVFKFFEKCISFNLKQLENALLQIVITLSGIVIFLRL